MKEWVTVQLWGVLACFSRPEMAVERVSYDVPTPSAIRGAVEAIYWKPEMAWEIRAIEVLKPIRKVSITRNEVKSITPYRTVRRWGKPGVKTHYCVENDRTQRHSLMLRDVAYRVHGEMRAANGKYPAHPKHRDQFLRRLARGECFSRPYLGCRECVAWFSEPDDAPVQDITTDLGRMLFDFRFREDGTGDPMFFRAALKHGVLTVPPELYQQRRARQ